MITRDAQKIREGTAKERGSGGKGVQVKDQKPFRPTDHERLAMRFGGKIVESWGDDAFLVLERDRNGLHQFHIRMIFGEMESYRFGPWSSEEVARQLFDKAAEYVEKEMFDMFCGIADVHIGSRDAGNYEEIGLFSTEY